MRFRVCRIPAGAGKSSGLSWLLNYWHHNGILDKHRIIAAGDSENDWDILKSNNSILVGNGTDF